MLAKAKRLEVLFGKSNLFFPTLTFELVYFYLNHSFCFYDTLKKLNFNQQDFFSCELKPNAVTILTKSSDRKGHCFEM